MGPRNGAFLLSGTRFQQRLNARAVIRSLADPVAVFDQRWCAGRPLTCYCRKCSAHLVDPSTAGLRRGLRPMAFSSASALRWGDLGDEGVGGVQHHKLHRLPRAVGTDFWLPTASAGREGRSAATKPVGHRAKRRLDGGLRSTTAHPSKQPTS